MQFKTVEQARLHYLLENNDTFLTRGWITEAEHAAERKKLLEEQRVENERVAKLATLR